MNTEREQIACDMLHAYVECAISDNCKMSQNYLKSLWPECSWDTIKKRLQCEGSTWYVFWMDGVRQFISDQEQNRI